MEAFFADVKQWGVYRDYDYTPNPELKGFSNDHPFPPEVRWTNAYLKRQIAQWTAQSKDVAVKASDLADGGKHRGAQKWIEDQRISATKPNGVGNSDPCEVIIDDFASRKSEGKLPRQR